MGSIGAPELIVLALVGLILYFVISRVRAIMARGAARIARQQEAEEKAARRPAPRFEKSVEKQVERVVEREKIIERQVVVIHCKFCKELTPVDLSECKSCGARLK